MEFKSRTRADRLLWLVLLVLAVVPATALSQHSIHSISFDPLSPITLEVGQQVSFTFSYTTDHPGLVLIRARPLAGGSVPSNMAVELSARQAEGRGSFTITTGPLTVDQLRFQMLDTSDNLLYETFVDVRYTFGEEPSTEEDVEEYLVKILWASWEDPAVQYDPPFAEMEILPNSPAGQAGDILELAWLPHAQQYPLPAEDNAFTIFVGPSEFWGMPIQQAVVRYIPVANGGLDQHDHLSGTSWILVDMYGQAPLPGTSITLSFEDGQMGGSDGCNRYWTSYTADGSSLEVEDDIAGTLMACSQPIMQQATAYTDMLRQVRSFRIHDQQLQLLDSSGVTLAVFNAA